MSRPKVSIIVPVYNMGDSIEKCINSLVRQNYSNYEIIVIDDGSTDDSLIRCQLLERKYSCLKVFHTENRGAGPARNEGIAHASGDYIYFPDADDILEENAISRLVNAIIDGDNDLVVFGYKVIRPDGSLAIVKQFPELFMLGKDIRLEYSAHMGSTLPLAIQGAPWNKLFKLNVIKDNNISFPSLRRHQDEAFIAQYMCFAKKVHFIEDVLYIHYSNDLRLQWNKYPVDYIDSVIGLYESRKDTIMQWNPNDTDTKALVEIEFICNVIKALELSFSPKMELSFNSRLVWIKNTIAKTDLREMKIPYKLGGYQTIILNLIQKNIYLAYLVLAIKVLIERTSLYRLVKK